MLSDDQVKTYLRNNGRSCPYCGESNPEGGPVEIDCGNAEQAMHCAFCGKSWYDIYELSRIIEIEENEENAPSVTIVSDQLRKEIEAEEAAYLEAAREQYACDETEIDHNAVVSVANGGAWVAAWVWVDAPDSDEEDEA